MTVFMLLQIAPALALAVDTPLPDSAQEARAKALFHDVRCVVCQSESIAESPADIAADMRRLIREKIAAGESDEAIKTYLVKRYGDYILMQPPVKRATLLLWFGPLMVLLGGGALAWRTMRRVA